MASSKWKTWDELNKATQDKKVVFWGASNWVERTLERISLSNAYVVDNNPNNHGIMYAGMEVFPPKKLASENKSDVHVIICTVNYSSVIDELHAMGFVMGTDFCCTPLLNARGSKDEINSVDRLVYVTSPQHLFEQDSGGGLYEISTKTGDITKRYTGKCRGICLDDDRWIIVDMLRGIVVLDREFKQISQFELPKNCEAHGICLDSANRKLYIGQPGRDSVGVFCLRDEKQVDEIFISDKRLRSDKDNHHVNDLCVHENSLFVSMFSLTGNWMNDAYDGGVLEIDLTNNEIVGTVADTLWMPHSVKRVNGSLCYLDSMRGILFQSNWHQVGEFNSFIRGLDFDGRYFYVGASEHRYPEKLDGISKNIGLDSGFYLFDPTTKMCRFFKMPQIESVHSLWVL